LCIAFVMALLAVAEYPARADDCGYRMNEEWCGPGPFGDYSRGSEWGWYGARRPVTTANEAKAVLQSYYVKDKVRIGKIVERRGYFEAEIKDGNGATVDVVIVDKGSGRIRSIR